MKYDMAVEICIYLIILCSL